MIMYSLAKILRNAVQPALLSRRRLIFVVAEANGKNLSSLGIELVRQNRRYYAKHSSKNISSEMKLKFLADIDSDLLDVDKFKADLHTVIDDYKREIAEQLSLRPNVSAYENLAIKLADEDTTVPLNYVAKVTLKNPQMLVINASACPDKIRLITDALRDSALSVNPQTEGSLIYIPLPKVTRERRELMAKNAKTTFNKCLERLRAVKNKYQKQWEMKSSRYSKDELLKTYNGANEVLKIYSVMADEITKHKQKELLSEKDIN